MATDQAPAFPGASVSFRLRQMQRCCYSGRPFGPHRRTRVRWAAFATTGDGWGWIANSAICRQMTTDETQMLARGGGAAMQAMARKRGGGEVERQGPLHKGDYMVIMNSIN